MALERFVYLNLVLVPVLIAAGWYFFESLPLFLFVLGVAYVTFATIISVTFLLTQVRVPWGGS